MDLVRKLLSMAGIFVLCSLLAFLTGGEVMGAWAILFLLSVSYFFSVVGVLITRFFSLMWCNMLAAYVAMILGAVCWLLPGLPWAAPGYTIAFAILGAGVSILAVRTAMKRVRAQYIG